VLLSGGLDSSAVAGSLQTLRGEPVATYSTGFSIPGYDEIDSVRVAARHFRTRSNEYYVTPEDVLESIPAIAAYCDEPLADASVVPAYHCARFARFDGTARLLAGNGGSEIFAGHERYATQVALERYGRLPALLRKGLIEPIAALVPSANQIPLLGRAKRYVAQAKVPLPDRLQSDNFLQQAAPDEVFEADFLAAVDLESPLVNLRQVYARAASTATVNRMVQLDLKIGLADNDLRKLNQACTLAGVDVAYPLLDDDMLELAARVPAELQVRRDQVGWFFRRALDDLLPREIIQRKRPRLGFPVGIWLAEHPQLRDLGRDSISALRRRGIFKPSYLDWVQERHARDPASDFGVMVWAMVMLEQWLAHHGH
jgi:asparagine synthase (glutamine-hydrolysing)